MLVEGAEGYRVAKDFMKMIMPSHAKAVQPYNEQMPLFARFQVESYLGGMFNPTVQLKSGGYIVIGVTEALVAIDVNSGRATKEGSIEDTATKTNLEAAEEIARQLRLRDLAGLIVIDFIDMEERKNNAAVEKRLKDKLKTDRARIQVGRISGFGLMEMSRQRLRPGMLESTTQPCSHCHGTGLIRSDDSLGLQVLRALEEEGTRKRSKEVLLKAPIGIINFLINYKREHIALIEARYGMAVRLEADPTMISPDYVIEKFKTATRVVPEISAVISGNASLMGAPVEEDEDDIPMEDELDEDEAEVSAVVEVAAPAEDKAEGRGDGQGPKKKRRRRRRRKGGGANGVEAEGSDANGNNDDGDGEDEDEGNAPANAEPALAAPAEAAVAGESGASESGASGSEASPAEATEDPAPKAKRPSRTRGGRGKSAKAKGDAPADATEGTGDVLAEAAASPEVAAEPPEPVVVEAVPAAKPKRAPRAPRGKAKAEAVIEATSEAPAAMPVAEAPAAEPPPPAAPTLVPAPAPAPEPAPQPAMAEAPAPATDVAEDSPPKPKRKGWWSLGR